VPAAVADHELAGDSDGRGRRGEQRIVRAQQQRQREPGEQRAARVEARQTPELCTGELGEQRSRHHEQRAPEAHLEVEEADAVGEQRHLYGQLVRTRIGLRAHAPIGLRGAPDRITGATGRSTKTF
jgi:hypothetical protein